MAFSTLPTVQVLNKGEREKFYAASTHNAIISKETFEAANRLKEARCVNRGKNESREKSPLQRMIRCGQCGSLFRRREHRGIIRWTCSGRERGISPGCDITQILETEFHAAFLRLYHKLKHQSEPILQQFLSNLIEIRNRRMLWSPDIIELNKRIGDISEQNRLLGELKSSGLVDSDFYISHSHELAEQLRQAKLTKERFLSAKSDDTIGKTRELLEALEAAPDELDGFDENWFGELVDRITVVSNEQLRFRLKNGLELTEAIERTVR